MMFTPDPLRYRPCVEITDKVLDPRKCDVCRKSFTPVVRLGKYCGDECRLEARRRAQRRRDAKAARALAAGNGKQ